jgi:hypothetical protein
MGFLVLLIQPSSCHLSPPLPSSSSPASAAKGKAWATLQRATTMAEVRALKASRMLLVPAALFQNVTAEYLAPPSSSSSSSSSDWRPHVRGILVELGDHGGACLYKLHPDP